MLRHDEDVAGARFAVTDALGGVSTGPFASLNLGAHVGDDPAAVAANRRRVAAALDLPAERLLVLDQVHGTRVVVAEGPWDGPPPPADAVVTRRRGLALAVLVADCTPVLLADPAAGVVGVAHAGRKGLAGGVVAAVLEAMRGLGATRLVARVGPSICPRCYEVPLGLREEVAAQVPESRSVDRRGRPALDVAGGVVAQLAPGCAEVEWLDGCTREDPTLFSYRRASTTGRYAGIAWLPA